MSSAPYPCLNECEMSQLMRHFPHVEPSYENQGILPEPNSLYHIKVQIPYGKKYYIWFTFYEDTDMCFVMELNRERKVIKIICRPDIMQELSLSWKGQDLALGTVFYVTDYNETYILEDVYTYKGIFLCKIPLSQKLGCMYEFLTLCANKAPFYLPHIEYIGIQITHDKTNPDNKPKKIPYQVHHVQYRSLTHMLPFLNEIKRTMLITTASAPPPVVKQRAGIQHFSPNLKKPQYFAKTIFHVEADIRFDVYHLFAYSDTSTSICIGLAYIKNYNVSVFMNSIFRKIRENTNLDYIEESDSEDDSRDTRKDKYMNASRKTALMECEFNHKMRYWEPIRVVYNRHIIHIRNL